MQRRKPKSGVKLIPLPVLNSGRRHTCRVPFLPQTFPQAPSTEISMGMRMRLKDPLVNSIRGHVFLYPKYLSGKEEENVNNTSDQKLDFQWCLILRNILYKNKPRKPHKTEAYFLASLGKFLFPLTKGEK